MGNMLPQDPLLHPDLPNHSPLGMIMGPKFCPSEADQAKQWGNWTEAWQNVGKGFMCNTFGNLVSLKLFCWMIFLYLWRRHCLYTAQSPNKAKVIQDETPVEGKQNSRPRKSTFQESLDLMKEKNKAVKTTCECIGKICMWVGAAFKRLLDCLVKFINRQVVQVLQWWVCAVIIIGHMSIYQIFQLTQTFWPGDDGSSWFNWREIPDSMNSVIPEKHHWLWWFSVVAWLALALAFTLTILMIVFQFIAHMGEKNLELCKGLIDKRTPFIIDGPRDVSIQVLLLPMVYGFLTAHSVGMTWMQLAGCGHRKDNSEFCPKDRPGGQSAEPDQVGGAWDNTTKLYFQGRNFNQTDIDDYFTHVYESNFALADFYEAFALYAFLRMVLQVLRPELRKKIKLEIIQAFESTLNMDVMAFVVVCGLTAVFDICYNYARYRLGIDSLKDMNFVNEVQDYFVGANWAASCIAIYNIFTFELNFHQMREMRSFKPSLKFWSIKIMVMIAFWAGIVMAAVNEFLNLSKLESKLFDASSRMYAVTFVSILNVAAWWPWGSWYHHVTRTAKELEDEQRSLLSKDRTHSETGMSFSLGGGMVPEAVVHMVHTMCPQLETRKISILSNVEKEVKRMSEANQTQFEECFKEFIRNSREALDDLEKSAAKHETKNTKIRRKCCCCPSRETKKSVERDVQTRINGMRHAFVKMIKKYYPEGGDF